MARLVRVRCKENTTDSKYAYFRAEHEYTVPEDHPCMRHFEKLETVKDSDFEEEQRELARKREELAALRKGEEPPPPPKRARRSDGRRYR